MTSEDLTKDQLRPVCEAVCRQKEYLYRLRDRMAKRGIPHDDPLYLHVDKAYQGVFHLWIDLHYRVCGVHKPQTATTDQAPKPAS
jgi:hypothetical protein